MGEVKPRTSSSDPAFINYHHVVQQPDGTIRCPEGYELIKEDDNVWRCTGGAHQYRLDEGEFHQDKFGNVYLRIKHGDEEAEESNGRKEV